MDLKKPFLQSIHLSGNEIQVLRLDAIHPVTGGNKIYKLKYHLQRAALLNFKSLLTVGGPYSNHLAATAVMAKEYGFAATGLVRGEEVVPLNKTLSMCNQYGMNLQFITRKQFDVYRNIEILKQDYRNDYCIAEGGAGREGVKGSMEIMNGIPDFDVVMCAVGTGTTLAGITLSLLPHQKALGICVLKGAGNIINDIKSTVRSLSGNPEPVSLNHDYHFGGYAKQDAVLKEFTASFNQLQPFAIEPVYTGKLFYGINDLLCRKYFSEGTRILAIHTGGLQYVE